MNIPCDCERCGGDDVYATCENALLMAEVQAKRYPLEIRLGWLCVSLLAVLFLLGVLGA